MHVGRRLLLKRQEVRGADRKETAVSAPRPDVLRSAEILHNVGFNTHLRMVIGVCGHGENGRQFWSLNIIIPYSCSIVHLRIPLELIRYN